MVFTEVWHIQNGVFDLDRFQTRNFLLVSYIFEPDNVKIYRYPKHRKTLSSGKLLLTSHYRTLTKQNRHVGQVLCMVNLFSIFGWVVRCFSLDNQPLNSVLLVHLGRGKKSIFAGFSGTNSRKKRPISLEFSRPVSLKNDW